MKVIGRKQEVGKLKNLLNSGKPELVAVLGRRRVGKTFLIKQTLAEHIVYEFTGLYQSNLPEHLERFSVELSKRWELGVTIKPPETWFAAFDMLRNYLDGIKSKKKKVVFLDEFPWMATNKSRFLTAFTDFWNSYAINHNDLVVVICGSSASWMINKVLKNKGGLHNRVTERITLEQFDLKETKTFIRNKGIVLSEIDIIRLYMAIGGIPFYLEQLKRGESLVQIIDRVCFDKNAILRLEYSELMASLFDNSEKHTSIIEMLNKHPRGLMRKELLHKTSLRSGGGMTVILEELEVSGFISSSIPYGNKTKEKNYKLKDYYVQFYLKYIQHTTPSKNRVWEKLANNPSYTSWSGLAFENVCLDHIDLIKKALKIDGIYSVAGAWHNRGNEEVPGAQIDLLIDRADNVINICEIKFSNNPYIITSDYARKIRLKLAAFSHHIHSRKTLFPTMITTYGLIENKHSKELVQQSITITDLI